MDILLLKYPAYKATDPAYKDINFGQQVLPQRDEGNDGGATNSFDYCQLNSVPKIKIDDVSGPEFENGQDDAPDTNSSRRPQSVGSSVSARGGR